MFVSLLIITVNSQSPSNLQSMRFTQTCLPNCLLGFFFFLCFISHEFSSPCPRRGLNPPHRVKSISMTTFSQQEVEFLQNHGNEVSAVAWRLGDLVLQVAEEKIFHFPKYWKQYAVIYFLRPRDLILSVKKIGL